MSSSLVSDDFCSNLFNNCCMTHASNNTEWAVIFKSSGYGSKDKSMVGVGSGTSKEALETTPIDNQNATPEGESMFHLHYLVLLHNQ